MASLSSRLSVRSSALLAHLTLAGALAGGFVASILERQQLQAQAGGAAEIAAVSPVAATVFGLGLALVLASYLLFGRRIATRMERLADSLEAVGRGEPFTPVDAGGGRDEVARAAQGFEAHARQLAGVVKETAGVSTKLIASISEISTATDRIHVKLNEQTGQTERVAVSMNEMSAAINEVASHASVAQQSAESSEQEAVQGHEVVTATVTAVRALAESINRAATDISALERKSQEIGGILSVIREVAEQTNLLALNAAIEAARAGEHGRGFAVVAEEVRNLATRTQESTTEIQAMIDGLQSLSQTAVASMQTGQEQAEKTVERADGARASFASITAAVKTISEMNLQIATAAEEQSTVAEEINANVSGISDGARHSAEAASEATAIIDTLGSLIAALQQTVARFNTGGDEGFDFNNAKSAHLAWVTRIRRFLSGHGDLSQSEAVSHRDCALGKWYYGDGLQRYGQMPEMAAIDAPHARLHQLVREIIGLQERGEQAAANRKADELESLSHEIVGLLGQVESKVEAA